MTSTHLRLVTLLTVVGLVACAAPPADDIYRAKIRRTSFGIPHIEASDLASVAFGDGYAGAQDHLCSLADQVVRLRGERSRYFGPGRLASGTAWTACQG
jgi:acyl-homoserine-lactone acylase